MKYMLDTNTCIYVINERPRRTIQRFRRARVGDIGVSTVVYYELLFGIENSGRPERNREALHRFLGPIPVLDMVPDFGETYGRTRVDLQRRGRSIGALDLLIGVHALCLGATLVTNNTREFRSIKGLALENWV